MTDCPTCEYHKQRAQLWRDEAYRLAGHPLPRKEKSMTQDEIIELARQAGFVEKDAMFRPAYIANIEDIKGFAKLVAEKEREACAKLIAKLTEMLEVQQKLHETAIDMLKPAIEAEREACAEIAEKQRYAMNISLTSHPVQNGTAVGIANQIRARGQA